MDWSNWTPFLPQQLSLLPDRSHHSLPSSALGHYVCHWFHYLQAPGTTHFSGCRSLLTIIWLLSWCRTLKENLFMLTFSWESMDSCHSSIVADWVLQRYSSSHVQFERVYSPWKRHWVESSFDLWYSSNDLRSKRFSTVALKCISCSEWPGWFFSFGSSVYLQDVCKK